MEGRILVKITVGGFPDEEEIVGSPLDIDPDGLIRAIEAMGSKIPFATHPVLRRVDENNLVLCAEYWE